MLSFFFFKDNYELLKKKREKEDLLVKKKKSIKRSILLYNFDSFSIFNIHITRRNAHAHSVSRVNEWHIRRLLAIILIELFAIAIMRRG